MIMVQHLTDILGDHLLQEALTTHPLEQNVPLPSPNDLKYKILVKTKKTTQKTPLSSPIRQNQSEAQISSPIHFRKTRSTRAQSTPDTTFGSKSPQSQGTPIGSSKFYFESSGDFCSSSNILTADEDFSDDDDDDETLSNNSSDISINLACLNRVPEAESTTALSNLVLYVTPVPFKAFSCNLMQRKFFEMISIGEKLGYDLIRRFADQWTLFNQQHLTRIYPRGTRIDSSNFFPHRFWAAGCQMVALNYQTLGQFIFRWK